MSIIWQDLYLSAVVAGRNDNYGGDFNDRLQNMVTWLAFWVEKYQLPAELIIVNCNPVDDYPSLVQALNWPDNRHFLAIRVITVSREFHESFHDPNIRKSVPLYEYIAKNIGIRRARGEFILSTNPDIIYDPAIIRTIAQRKLTKGCYYRADRADFKRVTPFHHTFNWCDYLQNVKSRVFRIFLRGYTYQVPEGTNLNKWLFRYRLVNKLRLMKDLNMIYIENLANRFSWPVTYDWISLKFHTSCSGDFMLMHRNHWHELHGHPEHTYLAIHTDALFVSMCGANGLKEMVMRSFIYHQDHERRYDSESDKENQTIRNMFKYFQAEGKEMLKQGKANDYNGPDWGLRGNNLPEEMIYEKIG